ncbi:TonB-dependent receptor domain-containing protein [Flavobacterium sp.]|uniref:TonB-dependent receptor domain-containing protein n=1 Tax=Flavobacterium sp. TaxID=239 RepID=UPI0038FBE907
MLKLKSAITFLLLSLSIFNYSQNKSVTKKVKVTGIVVEKSSKQPLEYATITFVNTLNPKDVTGSIIDKKGGFDINVTVGVYNIYIEFISFKTEKLNQVNIQKNTNLGQILLSENTSQLNEVIVQTKKSTVEIRLDKKIFNVGQDIMVKGGTASDVLENVPSVTVDSDGNVSLRGNENVKIMIDGKPSNSINLASALKTIPAELLDKIEVITNPSARYDAEGGAGIINIVLKKGVMKGLNGSINTSLGNPKNYGISTNLNYKTKKFNAFSTIGYNDSKAVGKMLTESDYFNNDRTFKNSIIERGDRQKANKGYNYNFGVDLYLTKTFTWTNIISKRESDGDNPEKFVLNHYETNNNYTQNRLNYRINNSGEFEYSTNFTKKFKKDGHKLSLDFETSNDKNNDSSTINNFIKAEESNATKEITKNNQTQNKNLFQTDYVLPFSKNSQFEAGFKGDLNTMLTDYSVGTMNNDGGITPNLNLTNKLEYKEKINAIYSQFGSKINKISFLFGLRYEDSKIDINLLTTNENYNIKYNNFFPSSFLTYQLSEETSISMNYSRRVSRPRNRFINPFSSYSSNVNLFQGNPRLYPSFTDALDFGYLTKWSKITFSSSFYYNKTNDNFQFIRRPNGEVVKTIVNGISITTPVILTTPINLSNENRFGFEFNLNYSQSKKWRINGNFNFYQSKVRGNYSYKLINSNEIITENFDRDALSWFTRISSRLTLPYKIEWQTNIIYKAPQNTAQGQSLGVLSTNLAFSKEVLNNKGTIAINVTDLFNSDKIIMQTYLPIVNTYSENQRRPRQVNLSFTYRFKNQKKDIDKDNEQNKKRKEYGGEGMDY